MRGARITKRGERTTRESLARMGKMLGTALVLLAVAEAWLLHICLQLAGVEAPVSVPLLAPPVLLVVNAVLLPLARRSMRSEFPLAPILARSWLIFSVAALLGGLLSGLVALIVSAALVGLPLLAGAPRWLSAEALSWLAGSVAFVGFGAIWWGFAVGQRWVHVETVDIPSSTAGGPLDGIRIAHVTDLHIGPLLRAPLLRRLVRRINEVEADVIVLTGDIFDFDPAFIDEGCRELAALSAPLGVYAVLGNHDVYTGADAVAEALTRDTSLRVLRDEWVWVGEGTRRFCLVGAEDPGVGWAKRDAELPALEVLAREAPETHKSVLLIHRPSFFAQAARLGFPVILTGHTHGGQLSPPWLREHNVSRMISRWTRGLYRIDGSVMYVNPGLGVAGLPVRLNCPREIALIRILPYASGSA